MALDLSLTDIRYRHIHLDFHTSPDIKGIGSDFDPDEYADTLAKARVDSICTFARCHHGWIYYDTKKHPERIHPHLKRKDLLRDQIEACHARNIRVPIYVTVQWDDFTAQQHPEWIAVTRDGAFNGTKPYQPGFYNRMCLNSPYVDFLKEHTRDILTTLPTDGFFFDIVAPTDCSCTYCQADMKDRGIDASDDEARMAFARDVESTFMADMMKYVRSINDECTVFFNSGHIGPRHRKEIGSFSHWELESLPSGGWGYMHFPVAQRYARNLGYSCQGMTGKFHTSWGDFHSFKNQPALEYECFQMLALGARPSVGDQLHPSGKICEHTYDLIGSVYRQIEEKVPWCHGAKQLNDIGVFTPEAFVHQQGFKLSDTIMGVTRMLQEAHQQFDIIDGESDLSRYRLLVMPDEIPVGKKLAKKIDAFVEAGGALIASHLGGTDKSRGKFAVKSLGVRYKEPAPYSPDFLVPTGALEGVIRPTEHVMYSQGSRVVANKGTEVLADAYRPYFNRTWEHFCSHRHTPSAGKKAYPGVTQNGRAVYFAHPVFAEYQQRAPLWCKQLVMAAINRLMGEPLLTIGGPSTILTSVTDQPEHKRYVVHLLHYIPERRGAQFDVIEDIIPVHDVFVSLKTDREITGIGTAPEGDELGFNVSDGRAEFTLPKLHGHQMIALNYA